MSNTTLASSHAWFNGEITSRESGAPSIASINFHLGTGVFDGLMAYWNRDHYYLHRAEEHLVRFCRGAQTMGMPLPWSVEQMLTGIQELLKLEPVGDQYVRPIVYRRAPELWVTGSQDRPVDVSIFTVRTRRDIDTAMTCHISPVERISSRSIPGKTKVSGAYVNSFNARRTAELAGFEDGLMLDREGRITEASAANCFFIANDQLITPPLNDDVFPGITREVILEIARAQGMEPVEMDLRPGQLPEFQGAFLCSTLMEIRALSRLGDAPLDTRGCDTFNAILAGFRRMTRQ